MARTLDLLAETAVIVLTMGVGVGLLIGLFEEVRDFGKKGLLRFALAVSIGAICAHLVIGVIVNGLLDLD